MLFKGSHNAERLICGLHPVLYLAHRRRFATKPMEASNAGTRPPATSPGIITLAPLVGWLGSARLQASLAFRHLRVFRSTRHAGATRSCTFMPMRHARSLAGDRSVAPRANAPCDDTDLDRLYREAAPRLTLFFRRRLRETDEAPDLVQEAFTRLAGFMARERLTNPAPYLQRIARNLLFERNRRRKRSFAALHVPIDDELGLATGAAQEDRLAAADIMRIYQRALAELPDKTRAVFLLHRVEDLTYREIGQQLGISIPTVQYHMARCLAYLDAALDER